MQDRRRLQAGDVAAADVETASWYREIWRALEQLSSSAEPSPPQDTRNHR